MDATIFDFWRNELRRLDLLLHRQILRLRTAYQLSLDEFRGLYISDEQVDALVRSAYAPTDDSSSVDLAQRSDALRAQNFAALPTHHPLRQLVEHFELAPFEQDVLLLALAPEIDLKYETLLAYLNNDVTRKYPTCDLTLRVFSRAPIPDPALRRFLAPTAPLFACGLLRQLGSPAERPAWLATGFSIAPAVAQHLLGVDRYQLALPQGVRRIAPTVAWNEVPLPPAPLQELQRVCTSLREQRMLPPILVLEGRDAPLALDAANALCRAVGVDLLCVDLDLCRTAGETLASTSAAVKLARDLARAAVYLPHGTVLFDGESNPTNEARRWVESLSCENALLILACEPGARWREPVHGLRALHWRIDVFDVPERRVLWSRHLQRHDVTLPHADLDALAGRFAFSPTQIRNAVVAVLDRAAIAQDETLTFDAVATVARAQSGQQLGRLAVQVACRHTWDDLVLPAQTLAQLQEVAGAIEHRHIVYEEWGFAQRLTGASGLTALFAGPSGTGKTMAAGVIARALGLDLFKIDLSGVVSKYIGETEKNLDRIFRAAQGSGAILFFDEADALFGKRSEVKDAHDRYANIEVAYLLQKLEDHDGSVILATNLAGNLDDAFSRRMHYVVQFALPNEAQRRELWRKMFPRQVPLASDVNLGALAKQYMLAGGDIRNVALHAAFLAAQDGHVITAELLMKAIAQQFIKLARVPIAGPLNVPQSPRTYSAQGPQ